MCATTSDVSLLSLVAHEMRAPLAVFKGYLEMLRDESLAGSEREQAARAMQVKADELEALSEMLMVAIQTEAADIPQRPIVFDVTEAIDEAAERIRPRARLEGATVQVLTPQQPVRVVADPGHVVCILSNLLANALTYTAGSAADVAVETRPGSPVEIAVHDRGAGIAPEVQERIFERFSRFAEGGGASGLGLGLSISRDLAESNGGSLVLEDSAPGQGSVFVLRLPCASE